MKKKIEYKGYTIVIDSNTNGEQSMCFLRGSIRKGFKRISGISSRFKLWDYPAKEMPYENADELIKKEVDRLVEIHKGYINALN